MIITLQIIESNQLSEFKVKLQLFLYLFILFTTRLNVQWLQFYRNRNNFTILLIQLDQTDLFISTFTFKTSKTNKSQRKGNISKQEPFKMGVLESHQSISSSIFYSNSREIVDSEFYRIPNYSYTHQIDPYYSSNYTLIAHKQKPHFELQKYDLFFNTYEEYKIYHDHFQWRNTSNYLVQARSLKERQATNLCATFHQATIYLERIPVRACEITDVPIEQGLYLLYSCFSGFRRIYEKTGLFHITLDMICINKEAMVKVWLNNNLSKNFPDFYSIEQHYTESEFLYNILQICQPLIDFGQIGEKFSDFLKGCCFTYEKSPGKDVDNKFCKFVKLKESNPTKSKKQKSNQNHYLLSFDKVIDYFEEYLSKYNLVVAREMKSIRDMFKVQSKIQYIPQSQTRNPTKTKQQQLTKALQLEEKQETKPIMQKLQILQDLNKRKRPERHQKNTRRTNDRMMTEHSITDQRQRILSYKSDEPSKHIRQLKEPSIQLMTHRNSPPISFGCKPFNSTRNEFQNMYSPQHIPQSKQLFFKQGRDRIKTVMTPNISFSIRPQKSDIQTSVSPNSRQKSISTNYFKNARGKQENPNASILDLRQNTKQNKDKKMNIASIVQPNLDQKNIFQINSQANCIVGAKLTKQTNSKISKKSPQTASKPDQIMQRAYQSSSDVFRKKIQKNKNIAIYYALQTQCQIDQEIAADMKRFQTIIQKDQK